MRKFYQYLVADLLNWIMNLFFQIQSFQLVIFCMDNQECLANLDYVLLCFFVTSSKLIIFCLFFYIAIFHLFFHLPELFHLHISYVSIKLIDYPLGKITSQGCPEHVPKKHLMDSRYAPLCNTSGRPLPTSLGRWSMTLWGRPNVTSWGCPYTVLHVTPWDVPYQRLEDVYCRRYEYVPIRSNI